MEQSILDLATIVYGSMYSDLLSDDLKYYSDREKREALATLREQAREVSLTCEQKQWLLSNTTC
jgi:hypothetical protein